MNKVQIKSLEEALDNEEHLPELEAVFVNNLVAMLIYNSIVLIVATMDRLKSFSHITHTKALIALITITVVTLLFL